MLSSRSKWTTSPSTTAARATNGNLELEEGVEVIEQDGLRITKKNEVYSIEIEVS